MTKLSVKSIPLNVMTQNNTKKRDGFSGEKLLKVTTEALRKAKEKRPFLFPIFITQIGYFPKAEFHYSERKNGCSDNILLYCVKGKGHYILDNKLYDINQDQFVILPATDRPISYWADDEDPWTIYWVHFTGDNIEAFNHIFNLTLSRGPIYVPFNEEALVVWENIYDTLKTSHKIDNLCLANFYLFHFLAAFLFLGQNTQPGLDEDSWTVSRAIQIMQNNLDQRLTIEELASQADLSPSHFSALFKKAMGVAPIDYFINLRMQKASQLLNESDLNIKNIALSMGYEDPYYFSRIFKKCIGLSPNQHRNQTRNVS